MNHIDPSVSSSTSPPRSQQARRKVQRDAKNLSVDGLRASGEVFFSSLLTRCEVLVPSQKALNAFFAEEFENVWRQHGVLGLLERLERWRQWRGGR
jgi:hypothetical protein